MSKKLNAQAMARRDVLLMGCIKSEEGKSFISADLVAGEPTVTAEFTQDPYYIAATLGMVGKEPFLDEKEILMIDDIYLMGMSVSPMGRDKILDMFKNQKFDGLTFAQMWVKDSDVIKGALKKERALHKILMLGLERQMGAKKMVVNAFKAGYTLSEQDAKKFSNAYWKLFSHIKKFSKKLEAEVKIKGALVTPFGYRLTPPQPYKALAWYIQSCVSGIINVLAIKFFTTYPHAELKTIIHDELIIEIPDDRLEEAKAHFFKAVDSLNDDLGWSIKVRCGWKSGRNLYDAK